MQLVPSPGLSALARRLTDAGCDSDDTAPLRTVNAGAADVVLDEGEDVDARTLADELAAQLPAWVGGPLEELAEHDGLERLVRLLVDGVCVEPPAFSDEREARVLVDELLDALGEGARFFHGRQLLRIGWGCPNETVLVVGRTRALWVAFVGYD